LNLRAKNEIRLKEYTVELQRKNEEIEQFAFVASHDLQQPLRSIANFTGLLEEKNAGTMDEEAMQYMNFIKGGAARMTSLIADLLEYSRVGKETKKEKIDCNAVINEIITDMNAAISETGAKIHASKLPVITGYIYIKSVFRNLLSNAVKFAKRDERPVIYISSKDLGKEFQFTVKDNGIGIDNSYKDRIFVIFQRLHTRKQYPGTGIGLSICKKIVELHGGRIWVESEPGKGSSFHFTISKNVS
jgi:light-regulated signal transduction histidine kinase (bacteriophytochrome)